jgi:hypothetical protein
LIVAFNFARDRGYCVGNAAEKTARAKVIETAVGILTVDETAQLLENAQGELVPYVAIVAFAGPRRAELERLDWQEVASATVPQTMWKEYQEKARTEADDPSSEVARFAAEEGR